MYRSSKPCSWIEPRPYTDPSLRMQAYGPLIPMQQDSFWKRLFSKPIRKVA
jgi:hypothetical protein